MNNIIALQQSANESAPTFDDFWLLYARRVARKDAVKAWSRLTAEQQVEAMVACVAWRHVWAQKDPEYLPHAATWLNGWRWEDELPFGYAPAKRAEQAPDKAIVRAGMPEHVRALLAKLRGRS